LTAVIGFAIPKIKFFNLQLKVHKLYFMNCENTYTIQLKQLFK